MRSYMMGCNHGMTTLISQQCEDFCSKKAKRIYYGKLKYLRHDAYPATSNSHNNDPDEYVTFEILRIF